MYDEDNPGVLVTNKLCNGQKLELRGRQWLD